MQHVHHVFGGNIAGGSRRKRTAADAAQGGVHRLGAGLYRGHTLASPVLRVL